MGTRLEAERPPPKKRLQWQGEETWYNIIIIYYIALAWDNKFADNNNNNNKEGKNGKGGGEVEVAYDDIRWNLTLEETYQNSSVVYPTFEISSIRSSNGKVPDKWQ